MTDALPSPRSAAGLVTASIAGVVGVAGSYAVAGSSASFVAVPVHGLVVDLTPAPVLAFAIVVLGDVGDVVGFGIALAVAASALAVVAAAGLSLARRYGRAAGLGAVYLGGWGLAYLLTGRPWASLGAAVPTVAVVGLARSRLAAPPVELDRTRRRVLRAAGTLGFVGLAYLVGSREPIGTPPRLSSIPASEQATIERRLADARRRSLDVRGIDGLVSPVTGFYEVDVDAVNPDVGVADWSLAVTGAVAQDVEVSYDDLTAMAPAHHFSTLRCVGESLNGDKMDNALWTGVPAGHLLDRAGVGADATHVVLHAADGFYEEFPLDALRGGLLAYGMNGRLLPRSHGFPVRALVPGHWGEVNVKWLTEVEVIAGERTGFWEVRGWHGTGPVNTVAKLHAVNRLRDGRIQVGGHAYAGTRGVRSVQVSTDGGETWSAASLSAPLPDADVWRQWAFEYEPPNGEHEVVVRAVDGEGATQPRDRSVAFPSGPTGWVSRRVSP